MPNIAMPEPDPSPKLKARARTEPLIAKPVSALTKTSQVIQLPIEDVTYFKA